VVAANLPRRGDAQDLGRPDVSGNRRGDGRAAEHRRVALPLCARWAAGNFERSRAVSDHDPIEDALRKLRPAELEPALMARLSAARPHTETPPQKSAWREVLLRWLLPLAASACVAVATFVLLEHNRASDAHESNAKGVASADAPLPVESQDYLVS